jgi:hypothetical protein
MHRLILLAAVTVVGLATACQRDTAAPVSKPPAALTPRSTPPTSGSVGSALGAPLRVFVADADGQPVRGTPVLFAITVGNGSVSPSSPTSGSDGVVEALLTLGTIAGTNEVTVSVRGVSATLRFVAIGVAGPTRLVTLGPRLARFPLGTDSLRLTTTTFDAFGNRTTQPLSIIARDTTLISVDAANFAHARRRGGTTYLVGNPAVGNGSDSVLAVVLAPGDSPCTAVASGRTMSLGEVVTDVAASGLCVRAGAAEEEYVLVPYFATTVTSSTLQLQVQGSGIGITAPSTARLAPSVMTVGSELSARFHHELRRIEARELPRFAPAARARYAASRTVVSAPSFATVPANAAVGDLVSLNVNADEYCTNPRLRTGRVAAVSAHAFVVADTSNPADGFTDADYRDFAATFDTLINSVDVEAFGAPSDVDANNRVVIFFTRGVNELTPRGSSSFILGFYFSRDLLPKTGTDACAGSNAAEMFYLLVPDPGGLVSDARSKALVHSVTNGTVAHEYQHLINASRRLYVNHTTDLNEETWLNEGLSHVAEELVFYRSARLTPGRNLGAELLTSGAPGDALQEYQSNNLRRYAFYLRSTPTQSPVGAIGDDDLETRGGAWSLLRYTADRVAPGDAAFWYRLVNGSTIGMANLSSAIGGDPMPMLRDWAVSVYLDDAVPLLDQRFAQPSWNFRSLFPAYGVAFPLLESGVERRLADGVPTTVSMRGGGVAYLRFVVPAQSEALLLPTSGGQTPPSTMQLTIARIR